MILNNLFLFILLDFCTRVFRLIWTRHTQQIDWSIWNGKKVSIVECTVLCMFWHFSFSTRGSRQKRDPWDYRWTLAAKCSSLFIFCFSSVDRYWMRKKRNTSWCNFQWMRDKKGKKRFVYSWVPVGSSGEAERIKNRFSMVNWTQIYLILNESQNIFLHSFIELLLMHCYRNLLNIYDLNLHASSFIIS